MMAPANHEVGSEFRATIPRPSVTVNPLFRVFDFMWDDSTHDLNLHDGPDRHNRFHEIANELMKSYFDPPYGRMYI
jgi:hypothetical protein